jgi:DNA-binding NarL/FixJ family response regulator
VPVAQRQPLRVLLVDDNPAVLRQIAQLLPSDVEIVATRDSGTGLDAALEQHHPDVVVLDVTLPGQNGIALAHQLQGAGSPVRIVFLTVHDDPDYLRAALAAGASAYVVKARLSLDLVTAIRAAFQGARFISPTPALQID